MGEMTDDVSTEWWEVGVWYCLVHAGVGNEDDSVCDFSLNDEAECERVELGYLRAKE